MREINIALSRHRGTVLHESFRNFLHVLRNFFPVLARLRKIFTIFAVEPDREYICISPFPFTKTTRNFAKAFARSKHSKRDAFEIKCHLTVLLIGECPPWTFAWNSLLNRAFSLGRLRCRGLLWQRSFPGNKTQR